MTRVVVTGDMSFGAAMPDSLDHRGMIKRIRDHDIRPHDVKVFQ
jgi:hypothetical protein